MTLAGKTALVTGSSRGIGRGIALKLAERGARVVITYVRDDEAATRTLADVRARGSDGFVVQVDVSQAEDIARLAEEGPVVGAVGDDRPLDRDPLDPRAELQWWRRSQRSAGDHRRRDDGRIDRGRCLA